MGDEANRKVLLFIVTVSGFLTPFMGSAINIALPSIGREFNTGAVGLNWVATSYLLAAAMFLVPFGRIADIYGRKRIFLYGIVVYTVSSLLCAFSTSEALLVSFRVLQGIGGAMIFGTGVAILTSVFPPGERGKALGINVASIYLGLSLGPFLGGLLTQNFGWRSVFLVIVPLGLADALLVLWKLKTEWAEAVKEKFDIIGSVIYSLTLVAIMYGFSRLPSIWGVLLIITGIAGVFAFGVWTSRTENPVLDIMLFRKNRVFIFSSLAALINYSATFAVGFLLSLYLQYIKGYNPQQAGLILVVQPVIQAVVSPFAGRLSDKIKPGTVASTGMAVTVAGLLPLIFLNGKSSLAFIVISLTLLGFGFALFSSPNTNAIMGSVEKKYYGVASGIIGTMRLTGQTLSMGITMLLFAVYIGMVQITPVYYPMFLKSMKVTFIIMAILCLSGIFASLARGKEQSF